MGSLHTHMKKFCIKPLTFAAWKYKLLKLCSGVKSFENTTLVASLTWHSYYSFFIHFCRSVCTRVVLIMMLYGHRDFLKCSEKTFQLLAKRLSTGHETFSLAMIWCLKPQTSNFDDLKIYMTFTVVSDLWMVLHACLYIMYHVKGVLHHGECRRESQHL